METVNLELFGKDLKVRKAITVAKNVSVTKSPVLIVGEIGVGKRTLGKFIHEHSNRSDQVLQVVDCSMDSVEVENSILGYRDEETGRFNKGVLELANGGTVIFANIDCIDEKFQKRLHDILDELEDYDIDVRIIATTSKNLSKLVGASQFYRGLYMLLSPNTIALPPLRERIGDLESLARHFARGMDFSGDAMRKILDHYWTYNVEELKRVVESSAANVQDFLIELDDLEIGKKVSSNLIGEENHEGIRLMSIREAEQLLIKKALIHTSENRTQAAKILGVSIRTLRNKINEYRSSGSSYFINLK